MCISAMFFLTPEWLQKGALGIISEVCWLWHIGKKHKCGTLKALAHIMLFSIVNPLTNVITFGSFVLVQDLHFVDKNFAVIT